MKTYDNGPKFEFRVCGCCAGKGVTMRHPIKKARKCEPCRGRGEIKIDLSSGHQIDIGE